MMPGNPKRETLRIGKKKGKLTPRIPRTPGTYRIKLRNTKGNGIEVTEAQLRTLVAQKHITPAVFATVTGKPY